MHDNIYRDNATLFNPEHLIDWKEDAANNFARGYCTVGREIIDNINNRLRSIVDSCDNCQGFIINHSIGGGTGSGLGALIFESLSINYSKKSKLGFEIYPSPTISTCIVEPYNAVLSSPYLSNDIEISVMLDNEAIYQICQNKLDINKPSYKNLNRLISKVISSMTSGLRFKGDINVDLNQFQTNLVPFPSVHFMMTSMAPVLTPDKLHTQQNNEVEDILDVCFDPKNFFVKLSAMHTHIVT